MKTNEEVMIKVMVNKSKDRQPWNQSHRPGQTNPEPVNRYHKGE